MDVCWYNVAMWLNGELLVIEMDLDLIIPQPQSLIHKCVKKKKSFGNGGLELIDCQIGIWILIKNLIILI
jgi:hypothetical protein